MLIAVRHGSTSDNAGGGTPERFRGHLPIPLTAEGHAGAMQTANELAQVAQMHPLADIHTSDLVRAVQSAQEISHTTGIPLTVDPDLRAWDTGQLAGTSADEKAIAYVHQHIQSPQTPLPGGESFNDFLGRVVPKLKELVQSPQTHVLMTHGGVLSVLHGLSMTGGQYPHPDALLQRPPVPASGVMLVHPDWSIPFHTPHEESPGGQSSGHVNS